MTNLTFEDVLNYKISTTADLYNALKDISKHTVVSQRVQKDLIRILKGQGQTPYINVTYFKTASHGISFERNKHNELILTFYTFKRGA